MAYSGIQVEPNPSRSGTSKLTLRVSTEKQSKSSAAALPEGFVPAPLRACSEDEYARAAQRSTVNEVWWYVRGLVRRGLTRPFRNRRGIYWYCIKPGFAWPLNFFRELDVESGGYLSGRLLLGMQWPVPEAQADSKVWMNVARDIGGYDLGRVDADKRRAIRKGFKNLELSTCNPADPVVAAQACEVWNSHVKRTGWNTLMAAADFAASWAELADWPGTTVLTARNRADGSLCAWLIARVFDNVVYLDTLASHTDRLDFRPNDAIVFGTVASAAAAGVQHAHYSLKSSVTSLEAFKASMGFVAHPFPCKLILRWPVKLALQWTHPRILRRLKGDPNWTDAAGAPSLPSPGIAGPSSPGEAAESNGSGPTA